MVRPNLKPHHDHYLTKPKLLPDDLRGRQDDPRVTRRMLTCKYFNGIQNKVCDRDIHYDRVCFNTVHGNAYPCLNNPELHCPCREYPTFAEAVADVDKFNKAWTRAVDALVAIKQSGLHELGKQHQIKCPNCCDGQLMFTYGVELGKLYAVCSTPGCTCIME